MKEGNQKVVSGDKSLPWGLQENVFPDLHPSALRNRRITRSPRLGTLIQLFSSDLEFPAFCVVDGLPSILVAKGGPGKYRTFRRSSAPDTSMLEERILTYTSKFPYTYQIPFCHSSSLPPLPHPPS